MEPNCRDYAEALATVHTEVGNLNEGLYFAKLTLTMEPHPRFRPLVPGILSDYFGAIDKVKPPTHYVNAVRLFNQRLYGQAISADISQIIFKSNPMMHGSHRRGKEFLSAAIRRPDFGDWAVFGSPFRKFSRHPDTPLPSFLTHRVFPRPTPERVFVANHQSGPRFSETSSSAPRPRPIGT